MSKIGFGYGSQWHLLRYLGYHRQMLNQAIEQSTGGQISEWIDMRFDPEQKLLDAEWKGLDFLPDNSPAKQAWPDFWPQSGNVPNWDAVGWLTRRGFRELLLVEAKAHVGELKTSCHAKEQGGLSKIREALDETKKALEVNAGKDWLRPYYQYCNRLAVLHFLTKHEVPAHLVFIYFFGDQVKDRTVICPRTREEWKSELDQTKICIGLGGNSRLENNIHTVYLPVCP